MGGANFKHHPKNKFSNNYRTKIMTQRQLNSIGRMAMVIDAANSRLAQYTLAEDKAFAKLDDKSGKEAHQMVGRIDAMCDAANYLRKAFDILANQFNINPQNA